ncbi:hypothetical protein B0H15DRAFT_865155 [Mycena belliarum]|uniref:F-box domain-containing protein n=1 Tax=Mycena belliarum TaxID=1033014 RepID=A0AAD6TQA3_9AGAR|nr:hypothetical protein B0H15DRAFT_865155 [Mycena belliae]
MGSSLSKARKRRKKTSSAKTGQDVSGPFTDWSSSDSADGTASAELPLVQETAKIIATARAPEPLRSSSFRVEMVPSPTDAEILRDLRSQLVELNLGMRYAIRRALDSFYYPILTVPREIIEEIFVFCLPNGGDDPQVPHPSAAPMVLLNVCQHWRNIALSTPRLWCSLRVNLQAQRFKNSLPLLECWLARARSCPLSLAVVYTTYEANPSPDFLIWSLTKSCEQWQDVRLELPFKDLQRLTGIEGHIPLLRKLLIGPSDAYSAGMQGMRIAPITAFSDAPSLREVHLVTGYPFTIELPWAQLTKLQATSLSVCECLEILEASPALIECSLSLRQSFDSAGATRIPALEHLEVLTLRPSGFHADLLHCLSLPVLRELQFHIASTASSTDSLSKITAFLDRSTATNSLKQIYFSGMLDLYGSGRRIRELIQNGTRIGPPPDSRRR